ncbi:MAG TPA: TolC family protein [Desulfuromonas sp.]|nr:TolC family protein [Desulfuromonas sp.]HBT84125.1 TolC family protein [Desulfuromonas sp.]
MNERKRQESRMLMRLLIPIGCLFVVLLSVAVATAAETEVQLETLVAEAIANNPEIRGSEAQWRMQVAKAQQAGSFDDPMLMFGIQNGMVSDPLAFDQDPMTSKVIGISQMFPFFGKRALLREGAEREAEAARWSLEERKAELRQMVNEAWAQLAYVETSLQLIAKNIALLDDIGRLAEAAYTSGMGKQVDIVRVQVERTRMEEMKLGLIQQRRSLQATFTALLRREQPAELQVPAGVVVSVDLSAAELQALALQSRPELYARSARIDKAVASERLARREYYPDFTLNLEYMQRDAFMNEMAASDGEDMYTATVSFNLPVLTGKRRAMVVEAQQEKRMAEADVDMLRNEIRRSIENFLAKLEASAQMARLYREGLLPQDEFARESTLAAYRAGQIEFMSVLDSQMKLLADEQKYAMFIAEHQMLRAQLEATVGTKLP